jgi:hypothetical protein
MSLLVFAIAISFYERPGFLTRLRAGSQRKGVIAKAKWGDETLYLLDRGMST